MAERPDSTRVVDLFSEALDRPAGEREDFVSRASAGDDSLRSRVTRLLSGIGADEGFMESPAVMLERREEDAPGQRVGAYELVRPLASGGMGSVWLARRADQSFEAVVALKLIKRGMDTDDILSRFRAERQVLAGLRHPNIAALLDGGATADGRPYLVMEYVDGEPIDRYCAARGLSVRERVALFRKVCAAVDHAHRSTVVHRDIKPANILVGADREPKLLDFGIAKVLSQRADATATRHRVLTPGYASPEQVRGEPITTATDVYSLGVVLYEMLTGVRPYKVQTGSPAALERAICETEPARPSTAHRGVAVGGSGTGLVARGTARELAGDLDTIVLMALRKEPERRYGSVGALSEDLRRYLEGLPVSARPDTVRYRAGKFVRRNKALVGAGVVVMASLLAGLAASTTMYLRARDAREAEAAQKTVAERKTSESERLRSLAEWRAYSAQIAAALGALRAGDVAGARRSLEQTVPALRGWEYRYAQGQLDASAARFVAHGSDIYGLALTQDGSLLATAAQDTMVSLWDPATFEFRGSVPYFGGGVASIAFSADGRYLAIPMTGRRTLIWDVKGEREFQTLAGHSAGVRGAAFSPDGGRLVTGGNDNRAVIWSREGGGPFVRRAILAAHKDAASGEMIEGHADQVRGVAFSPDGTQIATASFDGTACIWDGQTGGFRAVLRGHTAPVYAAAFSPDGRHVATASIDRTVRVWSLGSGGAARVLKGHTERIVNVAYSPDGRLIASSSWDRTVRLWDSETGEPVATLLGHENNVFGLAFSADGSALFSGGNDGVVRRWEVPRDWATPENQDLRRVVGLAQGPGWAAVAVGASTQKYPGAVYELSESTGRPGRVLVVAEPTCAAGSGDWLAAGLTDGSVAVLKPAGGSAGTPRTVPGHTGAVQAVAMSPDGTRLASGGVDGKVFVRGVADGAEIASWDGNGPVRSTAFSADSGWLAWTTEAGLTVHAVEGGVARQVPLVGIGTAIVFSPDGRWLAVGSGSDNAQIALFAWPSMAPAAVLSGHTHLILGMAFSPDSSRLASASMDHTVKLWDPQRGMEAATLYGHDYGVFGVLFSLDGRRLLTGAADGRVRIWTCGAETAGRPGAGSN